MKYSRKGYIIVAILSGMLALLFDSRTALNGASEGIDLCIRTVIPSLFPFFLLSSLLTSVISGAKSPLLKPLGKLCKIPDGSESLLLIGLLGGYPIGAQCICNAYESGQIRKSDAQRMLGFCNNAGAAFLFGMVGQFFDSKSAAASLWLIHIMSALMTAMVLPRSYSDVAILISEGSTGVGNAMQQSIRAMANVCGWVVVFRVILRFLDHWFLWLLPQQWQVFLFGFLELSNGCLELSVVNSNALRYICAAVFLAMGGLCVLMQTMSIVNQSRLGLGMYVPGKIIQTGFSCMLAIPVARLLYPCESSIPYIAVLISAVIVCITMIFLRFKENNSSIPAFTGV